MFYKCPVHFLLLACQKKTKTGALPQVQNGRTKVVYLRKKPADCKGNSSLNKSGVVENHRKGETKVGHVRCFVESGIIGIATTSRHPFWMLKGNMWLSNRKIHPLQIMLGPSQIVPNCHLCRQHCGSTGMATQVYTGHAKISMTPARHRTTY